MYSLVAFLEARVEALVKNRAELQNRIQQLETYVFEVTNEDCTQEYKDLVRTEVFMNREEL
jgi:prefoldin subunit 5